jgi:hypothetical protein
MNAAATRRDDGRTLDMASITRKSAGVAALAATAVLGLGLAGVARAADQATPTPTPTSTSSTDAGGNGKGWGPGGRHGFGVGGDLSGLATKLGVDETKLRDALTAVRGDLKGSFKDLRGSAKDGTQAERDALHDQMQQKLADALGKELGIDATKVKTALDELETAREAERDQAFSDRLDQAVKDAKLTQAEADAVKKAADAGIIGMGGPGMGGPGMGRGMGRH